MLEMIQRKRYLNQSQIRQDKKERLKVSQKENRTKMLMRQNQPNEK